MNETELKIAEEVRKAINDYCQNTARSLQAADVKIGVSDLGFCSERLRRNLDGQTPEPTDWLKAFIGTAVGDDVEKALKAVWPGAIMQTSVEITLEGETRDYILPGHPDIIRPAEKQCLDIKVPGGFEFLERKEISQSYQWQRNLYAIAAHRMGMFGDCDLSEVQVGNVFIDRTGENPLPLVQLEPVNPETLDDAARWLDDVVYAFLHEEEARKEPPREMCAKVCGFFEVCRGLDTDVQGRIDHPDTLAAVDMYNEGAELERRGKRLKNSAKIRLKDVEGHTPTHTVRWTLVNGFEVAARKQDSYMKLEVRKIK